MVSNNMVCSMCSKCLAIYDTLCFKRKHLKSNDLSLKRSQPKSKLKKNIEADGLRKNYGVLTVLKKMFFSSI